MLDWLVLAFDSIQKNPIVAGLFGTTVFAGLAVYLRSVPATIFKFLLNFFTVVIIFDQQQKVSSDMWGSDFRVNRIYTAMCRKLSTIKKFSLSKMEDCINDCVDDTCDIYKDSVSFIGSTKNTYWSILDGILISYSIGEVQQQTRNRAFVLSVRFYSRNKAKIYFIINSILLEEVSKSKKIGIPYFFNTASGNWIDVTRRYQYSQNIFMLTKTQQSIYYTTAQFLNSENKYRQLCKPYHIGFIFHGHPGCGKSQFVKKLAEDFGLPIYVLNLGSVNTDMQLINLIRNIDSQNAIILIEDVDRFRFAGEHKQIANSSNEITSPESDTELHPELAALRQEIRDKMIDDGDIPYEETSCDDGLSLRDSPSFSTILNILDGIYGTDNGLIFIATTNHYDTLDPAFVRPGRFDYKYEFGYMNSKEICNFIRFQFNTLNKTPVNSNLSERLRPDLALPISIVSNICFESDNINECIQKLNSYKGLQNE